ncbi:hypothetical protein [Priestia megaterium]|uniref:hypothetical protein n=1 Tax=Priestia megaterium TaxID=1404 RepID=UPI000BA61990|nr:hypothetical protein [Priestia megaterium]PAK47593.1 hypothetical protein CHH47_19295 [Priestia megaterium]
MQKTAVTFGDKDYTIVGNHPNGLKIKTSDKVTVLHKLSHSDLPNKEYHYILPVHRTNGEIHHAFVHIMKSGDVITNYPGTIGDKMVFDDVIYEKKSRK